MGPCRLLKTIFAQFLGKYRVVSALFGKIERLTFTGTFDAFQHLVKSHSFKQICFPHRSEMGVLKSFLRIRVDIAEVRKISKRFVGALACLRAILTEGVRTSIVKNTHPGQEGQDFCYIRAAIDLPELGIVSAFIGVKKFTDKEFTVYYPYVEGHYAYTAKEKNLKKEGASFKYTFDGRLLFENR